MSTIEADLSIFVTIKHSSFLLFFQETHYWPQIRFDMLNSDIHWKNTKDHISRGRICDNIARDQSEFSNEEQFLYSQGLIIRERTLSFQNFLCTPTVIDRQI